MGFQSVSHTLQASRSILLHRLMLTFFTLSTCVHAHLSRSIFEKSSFVSTMNITPKNDGT